MNLIVTAGQVREYLSLNPGGSSSRYSDDTINSNIRAAQSYLERECRRYFYNHPGVTYAKTTLLQAQVALPGFRTLTSTTWANAIMTVAVPGNVGASPSAWALLEVGEGVPDDSRLIVALQFRPWRVDNDRPWWFSDSTWFDRNLDSPFYPGNWGGGYAWTSMPNDLVIVGDGGYAPGTEPEAVKHTIKVLAAFYTMQPAALVAGVANTPSGGSLSYSELPPGVVEFVADWKIGTQVQSVG